MSNGKWARERQEAADKESPDDKPGYVGNGYDPEISLLAWICIVIFSVAFFAAIFILPKIAGG